MNIQELATRFNMVSQSRYYSEQWYLGMVDSGRADDILKLSLEHTADFCQTGGGLWL